MPPRRPSLLLLLLALVMGCAPRAALDPSSLRVGFFPNVTHMVPLSAMARGSFAQALAPATIEWKGFSSGPQAIEALFAGAIDVCYVGPGPATNGYLRSEGDALVVLAGAAEGGAGLVMRKGVDIHSPADLRGKKLAAPQLGNTQDVALRGYLEANGLLTVDRGGDVTVIPMGNPGILTLLRRGDLDGAWVPEPWLTRIVKELDGKIFLDEKTLWPGERFPTTVLVAAKASLAVKRPLIGKLIAAHVEEVAWLRAHPAEGEANVAASIKKIAGKGLPKDVMHTAYAHVTPTWDALPDAIRHQALAARKLHYLPDGDLGGMIDLSLLDGALAARGAP